jgi:hypothetical protein
MRANPALQRKDGGTDRENAGKCVRPFLELELLDTDLLNTGWSGIGRLQDFTLKHNVHALAGLTLALADCPLFQCPA